MKRPAAVALLVTLLGPPLAAQAGDPRLERLDAATRASVAALVDSARAVGLPAEPLVQRALEGATKRASGERIVAAVARLAAELAAARGALGDAAAPAELAAAAAALSVGARSADLTLLHERRPGQSLVVPLAVLTDLVAGGVPASDAAAAVLALADGVSDERLLAFRREVERDIALGARPAAAAAVRADAAARETALQGGGPHRP